MKDAILVLTNSDDGKHSDVVISKLKANGERVFRFDADRFATGEIIISFSLGAASSQFTIKSGSDSVQSDAIKSVWYRRPNYFKVSIRDPVQKEYAEKEIQSFLDGLWAILELDQDIFFLSQPSFIEKARKKSLQLTLALQLGARIPRTIITNDPGDVLAFKATCRNEMICKAVSHEFLSYGDTSYNIPTTLVTEEHLRNIHLLKRAPVIFQEYIPKSYELRVTVVADDVFSVKIDSQGNPLTSVDWRNPLCVEKLDYSVTKVDPATENFCLKMLRALGLQFGAFDFVVDKAGEFYFLEINPNGQWYWLEEMAGALISDAIVAKLKDQARR